MKTWKDLKFEALGLMFSRTDNGEVITLPNEDVADMTNEMADAANYALRDMATIMPIYQSVDIPQTGGERWVRYDLREIALNFMRLCPDRLTYEDGDNYVPGYDYHVEGDHTIMLRARSSGKYTVWYEAYPEEVTASTPDDQTFSLVPEALDLVPVYMAARIYGEEDISIAVHYLNQYQQRRSELAALAANRGTGGAWCSVTGWV